MVEKSNCIFCRIVAGELPSEQAYSDDRAIAFADISPAAPIHFLVVPKRHIERLDSLGPGHEDLLGHLLQVGSRVAADSGLSEGGYRLVVNQGRDAGQLVDHLHIHVLGGREMGSIA